MERCRNMEEKQKSTVATEYQSKLSEVLDWYINKKEKRNLVVFYHSDMDGVCSRNLIVETIKAYNKNLKIITVPYNYDKTFSFKEYLEDIDFTDVIAVDLSLKPEDIHTISYLSGAFILIDHHISTLRSYTNTGRSIYQDDEDEDTYIYVDDTRCATRIIYETLYSNSNINQFARNVNPEVIKNVDMYDRWTHVGVSKVPLYLNEYFFNSGRMIFDSKFVNDVLLANDIEFSYIREYGYNLYETRIANIREKVKAFVKFGKVKYLDKEYDVCTFVTDVGAGSTGLERELEIYDMVRLVRYNLKTDTFIVSLYTSKYNIDVSKIAESFGGGGHKKAAGYRIKRSELIKD